MKSSIFAEQAIAVIREMAEPGQLITAANIGLILRREFQGPQWKTEGYSTLKEFLICMERDGFLRVGESEHGALAAAVTEKPPPKRKQEKCSSQDGPEKAESHDQTTVINRPLRSAFWNAFAIASPPGPRYFNRATGELRLGQTIEPESIGEWVKVESIPDDEQLGWATSFLQERKFADEKELLATLRSTDWYRALPRALRLRSNKIAAEWNRTRSRNVARHVYEWATSNGVNPNFAFEPRKRKKQLMSRPRVVATENLDGDDLGRQLILDALSEAPTDWLLEIPIPAKFILRAIRNAKNDH